jgi:hypothetical protein
MSRVTLPTTLTFTRQFEELPLLTHLAQGERLFGALLSGEYEVSADQRDGDWWISDLWISTENGRLGTASRSGMLNLNADANEPMYLAILDALTDRCRDQIEETIEAELAENGVTADAA